MISPTKRTPSRRAALASRPTIVNDENISPYHASTSEVSVSLQPSEPASSPLVSNSFLYNIPDPTLGFPSSSHNVLPSPFKRSSIASLNKPLSHEQTQQLQSHKAARALLQPPSSASRSRASSPASTSTTRPLQAKIDAPGGLPTPPSSSEALTTTPSGPYKHTLAPLPREPVSPSPSRTRNAVLSPARASPSKASHTAPATPHGSNNRRLLSSGTGNNEDTDDEDNPFKSSSTDRTPTRLNPLSEAESEEEEEEDEIQLVSFKRGGPDATFIREIKENGWDQPLPPSPIKFTYLAPDPPRTRRQSSVGSARARSKTPSMSVRSRASSAAVEEEGRSDESVKSSFSRLTTLSGVSGRRGGRVSVARSSAQPPVVVADLTRDHPSLPDSPGDDPLLLTGPDTFIVYHDGTPSAKQHSRLSKAKANASLSLAHSTPLPNATQRRDCNGSASSSASQRSLYTRMSGRAAAGGEVSFDDEEAGNTASPFLPFDDAAFASESDDDGPAPFAPQETEAVEGAEEAEALGEIASMSDISRSFADESALRNEQAGVAASIRVVNEVLLVGGLDQSVNDSRDVSADASLAEQSMDLSATADERNSSDAQDQDEHQTPDVGINASMDADSDLPTDSEDDASDAAEEEEVAANISVDNVEAADQTQESAGVDDSALADATADAAEDSVDSSDLGELSDSESDHGLQDVDEPHITGDAEASAVADESMESSELSDVDQHADESRDVDTSQNAADTSMASSALSDRSEEQVNESHQAEAETSVAADASMEASDLSQVSNQAAEESLQVDASQQVDASFQSEAVDGETTIAGTEHSDASEEADEAQAVDDSRAEVSFESSELSDVDEEVADQSLQSEAHQRAAAEASFDSSDPMDLSNKAAVESQQALDTDVADESRVVDESEVADESQAIDVSQVVDESHAADESQIPDESHLADHTYDLQAASEPDLSIHEAEHRDHTSNHSFADVDDSILAPNRLDEPSPPAAQEPADASFSINISHSAVEAIRAYPAVHDRNDSLPRPVVLHHNRPRSPQATFGDLDQSLAEVDIDFSASNVADESVGLRHSESVSSELSALSTFEVQGGEEDEEAMRRKYESKGSSRDTVVDRSRRMSISTDSEPDLDQQPEEEDWDSEEEEEGDSEEELEDVETRSGAKTDRSRTLVSSQAAADESREEEGDEEDDLSSSSGSAVGDDASDAEERDSQDEDDSEDEQEEEEGSEEEDDSSQLDEEERSASLQEPVIISSSASPSTSSTRTSSPHSDSLGDEGDEDGYVVERVVRDSRDRHSLTHSLLSPDDETDSALIHTLSLRQPHSTTLTRADETADASHSRSRVLKLNQPTSTPIVEISSLDPRAAARATAILKLFHKYVDEGYIAGSDMGEVTEGRMRRVVDAIRDADRRREAREREEDDEDEGEEGRDLTTLLMDVELSLARENERGESESLIGGSVLGEEEAAMRSPATPFLPGGFRATFAAASPSVRIADASRSTMLGKRKSLHRTDTTVTPDRSTRTRRQSTIPPISLSTFDPRSWDTSDWVRLDKYFTSLIKSSGHHSATPSRTEKARRCVDSLLSVDLPQVAAAFLSDMRIPATQSTAEWSEQKLEHRLQALQRKYLRKVEAKYPNALQSLDLDEELETSRGEGGETLPSGDLDWSLTANTTAATTTNVAPPQGAKGRVSFGTPYRMGMHSTPAVGLLKRATQNAAQATSRQLVQTGEVERVYPELPASPSAPPAPATAEGDGEGMVRKAGRLISRLSGSFSGLIASPRAAEGKGKRKAADAELAPSLSVRRRVQRADERVEEGDVTASTSASVSSGGDSYVESMLINNASVTGATSIYPNTTAGLPPAKHTSRLSVASCTRSAAPSPRVAERGAAAERRPTTSAPSTSTTWRPAVLASAAEPTTSRRSAGGRIGFTSSLNLAGGSSGVSHTPLSLLSPNTHRAAARKVDELRKSRVERGWVSPRKQRVLRRASVTQSSGSRSAVAGRSSNMDRVSGRDAGSRGETRQQQEEEEREQADTSGSGRDGFRGDSSGEGRERSRSSTSLADIVSSRAAVEAIATRNQRQKQSSANASSRRP